MFNGLISAIRTLTIFPVYGKEISKRYKSILWFIVVGGLVGGILLGVAMLLMHAFFVPPLLSGMILTVVNYLITGGLHLDGLADTFDGFGSLHSRERTLDILKDPHIGTFGVAGIVAVFLWRTILYSVLFENSELVWLLLAPLSSRIVLGLILQIVPYARKTGGKAAGFSCPLFLVPTLIVQFVSVIILAFYLFETIMVILPFVVGIIAVIPIVQLFVSRLGGITGDGVGAANEFYEIMFLSCAVVYMIV